MRFLVTGLVYAASLAGVAVVAFFVVMLLAGPHSGVLPRGVQAVVLVLGWFAVLVLPVLAARAVWRRLTGRGPRDASSL